MSERSPGTGDVFREHLQERDASTVGERIAKMLRADSDMELAFQAAGTIAEGDHVELVGDMTVKATDHRSGKLIGTALASAADGEQLTVRVLSRVLILTASSDMEAGAIALVGVPGIVLETKREGEIVRVMLAPT